MLANRGGAGDNYTNTVFDDEAATSIAPAPRRSPGRSGPRTHSRLRREVAAGHLDPPVSDVAAEDTGTLSAWGLTHRDLVCTRRRRATVACPMKRLIFGSAILVLLLAIAGVSRRAGSRCPAGRSRRPLQRHSKNGQPIGFRVVTKDGRSKIKGLAVNVVTECWADLNGDGIEDKVVAQIRKLSGKLSRDGTVDVYYAPDDDTEYVVEGKLKAAPRSWTWSSAAASARTGSRWRRPRVRQLGHPLQGHPHVPPADLFLTGPPRPLALVAAVGRLVVRSSTTSGGSSVWSATPPRSSWAYW